MPINRLADEVHDLKEEGHQLGTDIRDLRSEMRRRTAMLAVVGAVFLLLLAYVITTTYLSGLRNERAIEENNRRWCPVVEPLAPRPGDPPPVGTPEQRERSQRIRDAFGDLVKEFGCQTPKASPAVAPTATPGPAPTRTYGPSFTLPPTTD